MILQTGLMRFCYAEAVRGREFFLIAPRLRNVASPRFTADGAVALVAPGAKGFFEPGLGSRGKLPRPLVRGAQMSNAARLAVEPTVAAGIVRKPCRPAMELQLNPGRKRERPVHGF